MITFKKNSLNHLLSSLMLLTTLACGTWAGNPTDPNKDDDSGSGEKTQVAIDFEGSDGSNLNLLPGDIDVIGTSGQSIGSISLTSARLSLKKIKLKSSSSSNKDSQELKGPYIVNLLTNQTSPAIETIEASVGDYREIKLQLAKLEEDDVEGVVNGDDPLIENSIHLTGTYSSSEGGTKSFEMTFDLDEEFFIPLQSDSSTLTLEKDVVNEIVVVFGLHRWFDFQGEDSDLDDISNSSIELSKKSEDESKEIRKRIKDNIKDSAEFSKKNDED